MTLADPHTSPNRLSAPLTPLIGREAELRQIVELLSSTRLLTLTGPGGIGKTRLALALADAVNPRFTDGVIRVALATVRDPALVGMTIMGALDLSDSGERTPLEALVSYLANRHTLLLLDNFEQVVEAAPLVAELLAVNDRLTVLVTSRVPLHIEGEQQYPVPPLSLPDREGGPSDAVALFERRARQQRPDFQLNEENIEAVAEISRRLDGLPLAIELAAARVKILDPPQLLHRLEARLPLLTGGARNLPARQRTMRDTIAWSYDLLDAADQSLFQQLAVFVGGWTLEAAEETCDDDLDVLEGLQRLVDHSLVGQVTQADGESRFGMLETLREFGLEQLLAGDRADEIRQRHAAYFLDFAERGDHALLWRPGGTVAERWYGHFQREHDNLRAVLRWATESGHFDLGLQLVSALQLFWDEHAHYSENRRWTELFLAQSSGQPLRARAKALLGLGVAATWQGDSDEGMTYLHEGLQLAGQLGADDITAVAYKSLGIGEALRESPDYDQANVYFTKALTKARAIGLHSVLINTLNNLAIVAAARDDLDRACALWEEAIEEAHRAGDSAFMALPLGGLGAVAELRGDLVEAERRYREGLNLTSLDWLTRAPVDLVNGFGHTLIRQGRVGPGLRLIAAAITISGRSGEVLTPDERFRIDTAIELAHSTLDESTYSEAWREGAAMSLADAIAYARAIANADIDDISTTTTPPAGLSKRELEVIKLLADGQTNQEIAATLFISPHTAAHHVTSILNKLGLDSRTAAATWAVKNGLV